MEKAAHMEVEYKDKIILALRKKYIEKQLEELPVGEEILVGASSVPLRRESIFEEKCSMILPESIRDMSLLGKAIKYRSKNRPQIIKADQDGDASFTFSIIPSYEGKDELHMNLRRIRDDMKKVWKQNVFYDEGKIHADVGEVVWMDFRSYCLNGSLYNLMFLFEVKDEMVLGNFHCSFPKYDVWKPLVLKLLTTIQVDERA